MRPLRSAEITWLHDLAIDDHAVRGRDADVLAGQATDVGDHPSRCALAVRPADADDRHAPVAIAQPLWSAAVCRSGQPLDCPIGDRSAATVLVDTQRETCHGLGLAL